MIAAPLTLPPQAEMYRALLERDPRYDGVFYVCVRTTGIFCRPSCRARKPRRENVEFVPAVQEALLRGYRACRVCRPMDPAGEHPAWARRLLEMVEQGERVKEQRLRDMGIEPARARRYFMTTLGMSFQAFQRSLRVGGAVRGAPHHNGSTKGPAPGGLVGSLIETPLRPMIAVASEAGLVMLEFLDRRALATELRDIGEQLGAPAIPGENRHIELARRELDAYFKGRLERFCVPLDLRGSPFQLEVWRRLCRIGYGQVASYAQIARDVGKPGAARAVGRANGQNRIAIIVPCHRVINADGSLCGYGGGVWRKKWLLRHEGAPIEAGLFDQPAPLARAARSLTAAARSGT
jgi:AraC family transcriptional regulator of adaptative response/methylated-DNA-[protein]-cysteine methyltransferase